ncbi:MAG: ATP-binding protein [Desulfobacterales bacterium]|nr:ATP-binding protein [Desulfobacterales bacterium]
MFSYVKQRISLKYIIITSTTFIFVFTGLFLWIARQEERFILEQVKKQAVILHKQIVLTRQWVSDHRFVLVKKQEGKPSNPFLRHPEVTDVHGTVYTKMTPSMLTRQLSDYAMEENLYSFNLTNINALNPENKPDPFEADALRLFESGGAAGMSRIENHDGKKVFRYAAPLIITNSCLSCHNNKNYRTGDIGGCISVFIPFDEAQAAITKNNFFLFFTMIGLTGSVVLILFFFTSRLIFTPIKEIRAFTRQMKIEELGDKGIEVDGDELKEFAGICYVVDKTLKNRHNELEKKIAEATRDYSDTTLSLKKANRELSVLNLAKTEFLSDVSHELRTPLASIKGAADILSRKGSCSDPTYLEIIKKNTNHLIRTIVDFLDYSKIEAGRLELSIMDESLTDIAKEAIDAQKTDAMKKGLKVELDASVDDCTLPVDRYRIYQVVSNLLSNAIKFSFDNSRIRIRISKIRNDLKFSITDQGHGIDDAHHKFIFNKFFQAPREDGMADIQKGSSGIGLAICKGLVEAHGGTIWMESKKGRGSTFIFTLPMPIH